VIAGVALAALLAAELAPLACPPGTTRAGAPPPEDLAEWCGKPGLDGVPRREGPARSWYDDGALRLEERWRDGERDGPFVEYHRNGRKAREGAWVNGRKDGPWTIWFESGGLEETSTWRAGVAVGAFVAYHRSGAKRTEGRYCGGPQCGIWRTFDEAGRQLGSVRYEEQLSP
jgi:antitoxin component YwqK of YwqJK toxin-antitoxin module